MKVKQSLIDQTFFDNWCPRCGKVTEMVRIRTGMPGILSHTCPVCNITQQNFSHGDGDEMVEVPDEFIFPPEKTADESADFVKNFSKALGQIGLEVLKNTDSRFMLYLREKLTMRNMKTAKYILIQGADSAVLELPEAKECILTVRRNIAERLDEATLAVFRILSGCKKISINYSGAGFVEMLPEEALDIIRKLTSNEHLLGIYHESFY